MAETHTDMPNAPATSFTCFSLLPYDIRAFTWNFAALQPRNLDIWPVNLGSFNFTKNIMGAPMSSNPVWRYVTTRPPPAILHASRESREVGLQHYHLSFDSSSFHEERHGLKVILPARIYFNISSDCICLMFKPHEFTARTLWDAFVTQVFNIPGTTVALNIHSFFRDGLHLASEFFSRLDKQKEVLLYYCVDEGMDDILTPQPPATIGFVELDESVIAGPVCARLKDILPAFLDEEKQKRATVYDNIDNQTELRGWTGPPSIKWVARDQWTEGRAAIESGRSPVHRSNMSREKAQRLGTQGKCLPGAFGQFPTSFRTHLILVYKRWPIRSCS